MYPRLLQTSRHSSDPGHGGALERYDVAALEDLETGTLVNLYVVDGHLESSSSSIRVCDGTKKLVSRTADAVLELSKATWQ